MGYNSSEFNKMDHYAKKTLKQLQDTAKFFADRVEEVPRHRMVNEELQLIKMLIADRIGKNKKL